MTYPSDIAEMNHITRYDDENLIHESLTAKTMCSSLSRSERSLLLWQKTCSLKYTVLCNNNIEVQFIILAQFQILSGHSLSCSL